MLSKVEVFKEVFYEEMKSDLGMHSVDDLVVCLSDCNGHVGRRTTCVKYVA